MKYLEIPFEKIVEYDDESMASIECPVCDRRDFTAILGKGGRVTLFCNKDEFSLTRKSDLTIHTDYSAYEDLSVDYMKRQAEDLRILFKKGLISYLTLIEIAIPGIFKNDKVEENVLKCENSNCEEPRTTTAIVYNGFEPKTIGVCAVCEMDIGTDL